MKSMWLLGRLQCLSLMSELSESVFVLSELMYNAQFFLANVISSSGTLERFKGMVQIPVLLIED